MLLSKLFEKAPEIEIKDLMVNSQDKVPNSIFFCVKGMLHDGHQFIKQAIKNGAICIVHSDDVEEIDPNIVYIQVKNVMSVMNRVASNFFGNPSYQMKMYGVTGTNGKSSIACMLKNIINSYSACGYVGTISIEYGNVKLPPLLTTPDVIPLQRILKEMLDADMKAVALEVSSIGVDLHRIDEVDFDIAIFTNLTHDHLDFHGTMENYFEAKKKFFMRLKEDKCAIINVDDESGKKIYDAIHCKKFSYGIERNADYSAKNVKLYHDHTTFTLQAFGKNIHIRTNLVAQFNVYNLLAVIAALHQSGLELDTISGLVSDLPQVDGRMEQIQEGQPFNVIVDFAHTPDGLEQVFKYASSITPKGNRIIGVFGSAGKRDTKKRPVFGKLADKYCDMIILTEDDPRDESPLDIAEEIKSGINDTNTIVIEDRYDAIRQAIEIANIDDTILILGKGDESFIYREFGREPWMGDHVAAKEIIHRYYLGEE